MSPACTQDIPIDVGMMVALSWNSKGWRGQSSHPDDVSDSGFGDVRYRKSAHEWWNFDVDHPENKGEWVYGYFHPSGNSRPNIAPDARIALFFASRQPKTGLMFVVGAYLGAEFSSQGWEDINERTDREGDGDIGSDTNIRCKREHVWAMEPKTLLRLDPSHHLRGQRIGMRNFTYLERPQIQALLHDMMLTSTERMLGLVGGVFMKK
ncbi:MAG: hypothetical protein AUK47_12930 [Deltaproteobacteria bacterium CG2_30_63_29]|nr:MAG: hypothetical protein AUK47_12930 [Deltaproteobacteria bacterium CG2_30_63_29]PJB34142.1 MAG: hypothetical protein CO108_29125 [Deltaproteobacteria bacterium CG_4_9_14_3_um_filter_63_12]